MYFRPTLANHYQKNCFLKSDFELVVLGPISPTACEVGEENLGRKKGVGEASLSCPTYAHFFTTDFGGYSVVSLVCWLHTSLAVLSTQLFRV